MFRKLVPEMQDIVLKEVYELVNKDRTIMVPRRLIMKKGKKSAHNLFSGRIKGLIACGGQN
jgi:hypothetical protein